MGQHAPARRRTHWQHAVMWSVLVLLVVVPLGPAAADSRRQATASGLGGTTGVCLADLGFAHSKTIVIGRLRGAGTGYQVRFVLVRDRGVDNSSVLFLGTDCAPDFRDIRFLAADGATFLPYWTEECNVGSDATVWVRLRDDLSLHNVTLHLLYGSATAQDMSNGYEVFDVFSEFSMFLDDLTWVSDLSSVSAAALGVRPLPWLAGSEIEGLASDGTVFYVSTARDIFGRGVAAIHKFAPNGSLLASRVVERGPLTHAGGIVFFDDMLWVPLSERSASPSVPSVILRYDRDLNYVDTWATSDVVGNAHWAAIGVLPKYHRVYVSDWGTRSVFVFDLNGTLVTTIDDPPDTGVQDWVSVDGRLFGAQTGYGNDDVVVWETADNSGDVLVRRGKVTVPSGSTLNGLAWVNGTWWSCNSKDGPHLTAIEGSHLSLDLGGLLRSRHTVTAGHALEARVMVTGGASLAMGFASDWTSRGQGIMYQAGHVSVRRGRIEAAGELPEVPDDHWVTLGVMWDSNVAQFWLSRTVCVNVTDIHLHGWVLTPGMMLSSDGVGRVSVAWAFVRRWTSEEPVVGVWDSTNLDMDFQAQVRVSVTLLTGGLLVLVTVVTARAGRTGLAKR